MKCKIAAHCVHVMTHSTVRVRHRHGIHGCLRRGGQREEKAGRERPKEDCLFHRDISRRGRTYKDDARQRR